MQQSKDLQRYLWLGFATSISYIFLSIIFNTHNMISDSLNLRKAYKLLEKREYKNAAEIYMGLLYASPNNIDALDGLDECVMNLNENQTADFNCTLGDTYKRLVFIPEYKDYVQRFSRQAIDRYTRAIDLEPRPEFYIKRGRVTMKSLEWPQSYLDDTLERAILDFTDALQFSDASDSVVNQVHYSRALAHLGNYCLTLNKPSLNLAMQDIK
jgi:tetratricopeptide (TPR) repeat protein